MKSTIKRLVCALMLIALIAGFVPAMSVSAVPAYDRLSVSNQTFYDYLKVKIADVASGKTTSTEFTMSDPEGILRFTKEELGISEIIFGGMISPAASYALSEKLAQSLDLDRVIRSLLADCPFELFWYDKIGGTSFLYKYGATASEMMITDITFKLSVSADYSSGPYTTNQNKISAASSAINNAKAIVAKHASKSDLDKLIAYRDEICQLVEYDHNASENPSTPYGNPWQLTNVFDNKANTNVVCEGYSKAFKYLCDLTDFQGDVKCYLVNGYMQGGTGEGPHMWNVVEINGGTLLVDVTNCDEGTIGAPDKLFLQVGQKNGDWYAFDCGSDTIYYTYSQSDKDLYTDGYLELKPAAVTKLATPNVTVSNAANGVKISWNNISGAKTYTVYKSTYSGGVWSSWNAIKSGVTATTYTDTTVKTGNNVKYTVRAFNDNNSSEYKASSSIKFLATPTVTVSNAANGVKISWNKITGTKTYTVYKSTYTNGAWSGWKAIKTGVTGTTYTDTSVKSNDNVKYTVRAFNGNFSSTYKSSSSIKFLATPAVTVSNAANGVKISWNKITGTKTYTVYKSTYTNGAWSGWKAIKTGVTGTSYTDTSVKSNANVRYTVRAVNGSFASYFKASSSIKFLATPTVKATNAAKGVTVTWNKITGAKSYTVYRSVYSGGKWSGWTAIKTGVTGTSYTDTTVKSGATVRYTVKAINGNFRSNVKTGNTTKYLAQPKVTVAKVSNGIKASWGKITGASGYIVYRRTYTNGKWSGWTAIKTTTAVSFTDTTAKKGATYQYTVRAYSGDYRSSYTNSSSVKR